MPSTKTPQGAGKESSVHLHEITATPFCQTKGVDRLHDELTAAMASNVQTPYGQIPMLKALESDDMSIFNPAADVLVKHTEKIGRLLVSDERFPKTDNYALRLETGHTGIYPSNAAQALLHRLNASGSTSDAIAWLRRVIAAKNGKALLIETLWSVPIRKPLQLTKTIQLMPIAELPDSPQKSFVLRRAQRGREAGLVVSGLNNDFPRAALVGQLNLKRCIKQMYVQGKSGQEDWEDSAPDRNAVFDLMTEFRDISMVMTLSGPRPVIGAAHWIEYEDPDLKFYGDFLGSWSSRVIGVLPLGGQSHQQLDAVEVQQIISEFLRLDAQTKLKIRLALERFNLALRRRHLGDLAIDLCIALESLVGGNETNEVTHKVTTRTARFLGGDVNQRTRTRDVIKATYTYRSAMVHNAQTPKGSKSVCGAKMNASDILAMATSICVDVIKAVLRKGKIPDWQDFDISLGNEQ